MSKLPRIPKYRRNPDGRAFVYHKSIPTKSHRLYLGSWGTAESRKDYERWVSQFLAAGMRHAPTTETFSQQSVAGLVVEYLAYARSYYSHEGLPTKEFRGMETALGHLLDLFAADRCDKIGPRHLTRLQNYLVTKGYRRGVINQRISRVRRFFRWACTNELIPPGIYHTLSVVAGLRRGRCSAPDSAKVRPVALEHVEAVLPYVSPVVCDMAQVQYLCGMRPSEVCIMRAQDIDRRGPIWLYRPESHKTIDKGYELVKAIPKAAQEILLPYILKYPEGYLFRPEDATSWRYENRPPALKGPERKTPVYPSELVARERKKAQRKKKRTGRKLRERYCRDSYRRALEYGQKLANRHRDETQQIPHWFPYQLRHTIATEISHSLGEQQAQVWLGHSSLETTAIYTERNVQELVKVALLLESSQAIRPCKVSPLAASG